MLHHHSQYQSVLLELIFELLIAAKHCKPIQQLSTDGTLIEEFDSTYDAQAKLGISNSNICACLKGRRKMAGGFLWKYK